MIETKDSGINRIGEIPKHWKFISVQYLSKIYNGNSISDEEKDNYTVERNIPYIATKDVSLDYCVANYENGLFVPENSKFRIAPAGSTLLCIEGGSAGRKKAYLTRNVAFVNKLCAFVPKDVNGKFLFYAICSPIFKLQFDRQLTGIIGGVSPNTIKKFKIPVPPIDEQKAISDFLDKECGKIDEIISGVKNQIEILKEYKKSLITETVTKGLNPTAEMKDSGINRIGEIPKHWKISKLKYVSKINEKILSESTPPDYKFRYVDISSIKSMVGIESYKEMTFDVAPSRARRLVSVGDTIISTVRTYLRAIAFIDESANIVVSTGFSVHTPLEVIYPKYLYYVCISDFFIAIVNEYSTGVSYPAISDNLLGRISVPVPPLDEQKAISDFLDDKCKKIDELIEQKQKQLETLAEYKKSVIYEYVTGKKRVEEC